MYHVGTPHHCSMSDYEKHGTGPTDNDSTKRPASERPRSKRQRLSIRSGRPMARQQKQPPKEDTG